VNDVPKAEGFSSGAEMMSAIEKAAAAADSAGLDSPEAKFEMMASIMNGGGR
jgi:hypothetical protein